MEKGGAISVSVTDMVHIPVISHPSYERRVEFSYFDVDADAGYWKKENVICVRNIKINVFVEGEFSLFARDGSYRPTYGDICVLMPNELHRGHVYKKTHVHYYQIDIGEAAFDGIDGGGELLSELVMNSKNKQMLFKPDEKSVGTVMQLCEKLRDAVKKGASPLAFAFCIELVVLINSIYEGGTESATYSLSKTTRSVISHIEKNFSEKITIESLSDLYGLSPSYLSRIFKKETGASIHEYLNDYRVCRAARLLSDHSVAEVCYMCGFSDSSHFIAVFKKRMGKTPMAYKKDIG